MTVTPILFYILDFLTLIAANLSYSISNDWHLTVASRVAVADGAVYEKCTSSRNNALEKNVPIGNYSASVHTGGGAALNRAVQ
jgi:hypothetical protein